MADDREPTIKSDAAHEAMVDEGYGKAKAASVASAQANGSHIPSQKNGDATPYEDWSEKQLYEYAQGLDIDVDPTMSKVALISALRGQ